MSMQWLSTQLMQAGTHGLQLNQPRYNPRPAGQIRPGSATQYVLDFLRARPYWCTYSFILVGTGRTAKSLDHALLYLRALDLVECVADEARNPKYLRYRAAAKE
jgi:hypothetical protein